MIEQNAIPIEWRKAADETAKALSVARAIERHQYPEGDAPDGLVAALTVSAMVSRASAEICNRIEGVYDALNILGEPELIPCLRTIAGGMEDLVRVANHVGWQYGKS